MNDPLGLFEDDTQNDPLGLFGDSSKEETADSLFADRQRQIIPDLVKNVGGLIDTGAGMLAGMPANIYGGLRGASSILAGEGIDMAVKRLEDARTSNFGFGKYKPVSKAGAEYTESVGKAFNKPVEIAGNIGESLGGNEGRFVGELLAGSAMELLDPLVPFAIAKGGMKKFSSKTSKPVEAPKLDNIEKRLDAMVKRDPSNPAVGQMELFPDTLTDTTGYASPYDASTVGTTEPIAPKRARRQQELQLDQNETLPVDAEGNVGNIDLGTKTAMEQQRIALERELDATQPIEGLKATEGEGGQQALFDIDESARMPNPTEAVTGDWRIDENGIPVKADLSMEAANLENAAQRNLWGDELPPKHEQELANTSILDNFKNSKISGKGLGRQRGAVDPDLFKLRFPEFSRSKIVDASGKLKPLIRGVRNDYAYPERTSLGKFGKGVYLTENKQVAGIFAGKSGNTRQAYVNMTHPYEISVADDVAYRKALDRSSIGAEDFAQKLREQGHDGIILRDKDGTIREAVVFDPENVKNAFTLPKKPLSLKDRPIGQRGPANSQTGATTFFSFGKKDAKELIRDNNSKLNKIEQDLNNLSKSFWQDRSISSEDFRAQQADLLAQQRELEQVNRKWQQTLPPQRETEIHPGYKKIPLGAEVLTDRRGSMERATVRENRQSQFGDTTTWYPRVEFSDGQMKRLLPSDIKKVVRDPFKGPGKKQAGAIRLPFGKKPAVDQLKKIEGIKNDPQMRNIFPEKLSVEEVIKEHAALKTPDVDQNGLQKLMNLLTKGSLYQAIKTDNPIVRVVGEKIRQANNYAMEATGRLVHDGLAPLARKLSKKEKADVWAVQQMAEAKGVTLTPEFLREEGFNQKQIDWVTEHKSVMDDMYSRMSDSMKAAGLEPVSARVAYVASRARGDFRRLIMKDNKVVGIMGDNTRMGLNKQIERLKKDHPEYEIGQERYYGGRAAKGTEEGFMQMLDFLSKDNPDFKLFVNHVNDMLSQDAFQYMNAKSHTMQKKRIEGMEGRKLYADAVKNAEEGMQAQIRYAETMIKWSELSKAIAEIKPLLKQDNGLDMPNAKEWANEYIQGALGNSPGELGKRLDDVTASLGKISGLGTTNFSRGLSAMKSYVNGVLLGFGNVGFLTANAIQLPRTMPEMAAWLNTKGIEAGYDLGLGRALITVQKQLFNSKLTDLERGAFEYAKKNHVYSSNLFESGNTVSKGLSYYWQKGTQMIASALERETRKVAFFAYTHMLDEAGITPSDGLYEAAQNLTDMHMNNYAQAEAPRVYQETGGIGRSAYNLMSFKHNELSRLAMFAREIPNGQGKPILTAMASQVAFAGLIGTLGFAEADAMYEWLTAKMGEPTSLTKILLDNPEIPDALKFGMGSLADVDLTNRMGLQLTPGSMIDLVAPGFGKLGDIAGAVGEMVSQPNLYNAANVAREALPLSVGGIMDRTIFETEDGMALNRNKVSASAVRNDADKLWKALGMTGVNESVQKKLSYENQKIDQVYKDKRSKVIDGAIKEYYMRGVMPDNWVERYIELQGDPKEAKAAIQARIEALNVDRPTKELMQNAASKSISSQHKLLRRLGME